ncbi:division/cell wall cluster transcriptional repressor MraZ [Pseudooceanicola sp.]|uniref:division/cell wall cluster transcriptional repressor MraZ n=1 Tax=Pseudooceanicola sp. TaxID=1914328 RepID=UPI00405A120A
MSRARFRGEHHLKMDSKGRVSIPAEFRRALEANDPDWSEGDNPRMYIHYGENLKGGLEVYTVKAQEEIEDIVLDMDYGPERELSEDYFLTSTQEVKLDDTGRAVLPQMLRNKLALEDGMNILARGRGATFEMWNPDTHRAMREARTAEFLASQPANFDPKSLLNDARRKRDEQRMQGRD